MAGVPGRPSNHCRSAGDTLALPVCLTWAVAQLGAIALGLPTAAWAAPGLIAGVLSLMLLRRRESIVYFWVAALFFLLFMLTGDPFGP